MFGFGKRKKGSNFINEQEKRATLAVERVKAAGYAGLRSGGLFK